MIYYRGTSFNWELKRSQSEAEKKTGRIVLQRFFGSKIAATGNVFRFVYPENVEECFDELLGIKPTNL